MRPGKSQGTGVGREQAKRNSGDVAARSSLRRNGVGKAPGYELRLKACSTTDPTSGPSIT